MPAGRAGEPDGRADQLPFLASRIPSSLEVTVMKYVPSAWIASVPLQRLFGGFELKGVPAHVPRTVESIVDAPFAPEGFP